MAGARDLILNGFMQSDLDANNFKILNLDISNLGIGSLSALLRANNLSDLTSVSAARTNLGLTVLATTYPGDIGRQLIDLGFPISATDTYIKIEDGIAVYQSLIQLKTAIGAEPHLGNPLGNGYVLVSTMAGVRSWAAPGSGTPGSGTVTSVGIKSENGILSSGGPITAAGEFTLSLGDISPTSVNGLVFNTLIPGSSMQIDGAVFLHNLDAQGDVVLSGNVTMGGDVFFAGDVITGGRVDISGELQILGGDNLILQLTGPTTLTLPVTGTVATVAGTEPALGNPSTNGYVLSSNTAGVRSWVAGGTGTGNPFSDAAALVKNAADQTKLLRFDVSGISTGTTRVLTPPNYNGTITTLAGTETLTNKTITSPVISNATASTFAKFDALKNLVSAVAGTDYITVTGTPTAGQIPIASSGTTAAWGSFVSGTVDDAAFSSEWNGSTLVAPSQNAVYDWGITLVTLTGAQTITGQKTFVAPLLGVASATSLGVSGVGGLGFVEFIPQSSNPSLPIVGYREFADSTGRKSWIRASDGFRRTWDAGTLTADRVYGLPDVSGTVALTSSKLNSFASTTSGELRGVISDETGTGALVFANTPTLITPVLGAATATSITLSSGTVYGVGWNGSLAVPTQNDVYDKIESLVLGSGSVATDAIFDAKGDLPVGTGSDTAAKLSVGANDTIAIADSAEATGIRWGTPASVRTALALVPGTDVQTFNANLLVIGGLADPNADRLLFWDDSAGAYAYLTAGTNLTISGTTLNAASPSTNISLEAPGFSIDGAGSAISTGKVKGFFTCPYAATITGWSIVADTGTVTVKVWKIASGTAKPTVANSINTSGVALSTGTAVVSTTVTDFTTTTVTANDIFAYEVTAVSGVTDMTFNLRLVKS